MKGDRPWNLTCKFQNVSQDRLPTALYVLVPIKLYIFKFVMGTFLLETFEPRHEKTGFCICETKDADQLCGNRTADQRLCFGYTDSTIPLLPYSRIFKPLAIFCGSTARFVSYLVGNPEDRFSHNEAHFRVTFHST